jgi:hypothetical protein
MRTMYDSVTARDIPGHPQLVAGYANGRYAWSSADWRRFAPASHVMISVKASYFAAIVLDVEPGNDTPAQAPGWVAQSRRVTGWTPTLYGSRAWLDRCRILVDKAGLDCDFWLAEWTGVPHLPAGFAACQYAAPGHGSPGHFDLSVVADWWPRTVGTPRPV